MKKGNRKGFTLIELMVVAVIVAILAAVAIPLLSGNKRRAAATEGQAGCSAIKTAVRVYIADKGSMPAGASGVALITELAPTLQTNDLQGAYFSDTSYVYAPGTGRGFTVTATADNNKDTRFGNGTVILTVADDQSSTWTGTLLQ